MTTGWGDRWGAPRAAWELARETASGRGAAALKEIPDPSRPLVMIALGAQIRSFLTDAAMHGVTWQPPAEAWEHDVPCPSVRQLAMAALSDRPVRMPAKLCHPCTAAMLREMTEELLTVMTDAGVPAAGLTWTLDFLVARARR